MDDVNLLIFDDGLGRWGPLTRTRAIFSQRTGMVTTRRRIQRVLGMEASALHVPARLRDVVAARHPGCSVNEPVTEGEWLLVNGRWLALTHVDAVRSLTSNTALVDETGVIAARLAATTLSAFLDSGATELPSAASAQHVEPTLITRPWHVLDHAPTALDADLHATRLSSATYHELREVNIFGSSRAYIGDGARIDPGVILNVEKGPIAIDDHARVQAGAMLEGPCAIGRNSEIVPHAYIRQNTIIGPVCKIGGELSGSIIQGYTNKAHDGCLGDSIVGAWCNLGAATVVSNLKNTYGNVRVRLDADSDAEDTGRRSFGPILGELVRTAIGTRVLTGAIIETGNMLAMSGFAPKLAPPLGFYTDEGRSEHDVEKLIATARTMMSRRQVEMTEAEAQLLRALADAG